MRLHILSDLHLEFGPFSAPPVDADLVILAGDVHIGREGLRWIRHNFRYVPVIYVLGNHEFYGEVVPTLYRALKQDCHKTNVHLLENDVFEIDDVVVLGATLWTDFALNGDHVLAETMANIDMNDFKQIRIAPDYRKFSPADSRAIHLQSRRWLDESLQKFSGRKTVVVTHHAPSKRSINAHYLDDPLNPGFVSNLEPFIEKHEPMLWVHGHLHSCADYRIGRTRVLANPRGYPRENTGAFNPELVVEI
jgi:predicted phosphohydrolase